jgi:hypothetical protein
MIFLKPKLMAPSLSKPTHNAHNTSSYTQDKILPGLLDVSDPPSTDAN